MKTYIFLLFLLLACTSKTENSSSTVSMSNTSERDSIDSLLHRYYKDMSARDWKKYRHYFWDYATITTAWQAPGDSTARVDVTMIDDFIKETPSGPDSQPIFEETMNDSKITTQGNLAVAWANYKAKFGTSEKLMEWSGTDLFTLMRHRGEWRIVSLAFEGDK